MQRGRCQHNTTQANLQDTEKMRDSPAAISHERVHTDVVQELAAVALVVEQHGRSGPAALDLAIKRRQTASVGARALDSFQGLPPDVLL